MIGTILTDGNSVAKTGTFDSEVGLTQIMIAIDPTKFQSAEITDAIINAITEDVKASTPINEGEKVRCPGEGDWKRRQENRANGIPVAEEKWNEVLAM